MKRLSFIYIFSFLVFNQLAGQVDIDSASDNFQILKNYEISTGKSYDSKSSFKFSRGNLFETFVSFEQKLSPSISFIARFELVDIEPGLEARYYLNQSKLVEEGFGNNINGLYFTAGAAKPFTKRMSLEHPPQFYTYFGIGAQSRILKYGFMDLDLTISNRYGRINVNPSAKLGIVVSKNYRKNGISSDRCNILNCFEERKFQFKLKLNNSFFYSSLPNSDTYFLAINPRIKFEHRILKGLSMNHGFNFLKSWDALENRKSNSLQIGYSNSLRLYFLKTRNIAKGRSADNLSGIYVESHFNIVQLETKVVFISDEEKLNFLYESMTESYGGAVGYQTRLFKHLYIDIQYLVLQSNVDWDTTNPNQSGNLKWFGSNFNLEFGLLF